MMKGIAAGTLILLTGGWMLVAWTGLAWVLLSDPDAYTEPANASALLLMYLAAPTGLVLSWSFLLQHRLLPTARQVRFGFKAIGVVAIAIVIIIVVAFGIGWLFDNTGLGSEDFS
jgi:hypothetical protein